jgi:hypothetical protein
MTSYLPIYKQNALSPGFNHTFQHKIVIDTRIGINFKTVKFIYKDSVFPTSKAIIKEIKEVMGIKSRASSAPTRTKSTSKSIDHKTKSASKKNKNKNKNFSFNPKLDSTLIPYATFVAAVKKIVGKATGFSLMEQFRGNHYNFVCRTLSDHFPINRVLLHRAQSNERANRNRNEYIAHKLANPILNFRLFLDEFLSDETRLKIGRVRTNRTYESNLVHILSIFDEYLIRGVRKSVLIITIDTFIDELNKYIGAGFFTMKEVTADIIRKLSEIIDGEPPIVGEEPYVFHRLL